MTSVAPSPTATPDVGPLPPSASRAVRGRRQLRRLLQRPQKVRRRGALHCRMRAVRQTTPAGASSSARAPAKPPPPSRRAGNGARSQSTVASLNSEAGRSCAESAERRLESGTERLAIQRRQRGLGRPRRQRPVTTLPSGREPGGLARLGEIVIVRRRPEHRDDRPPPPPLEDPRERRGRERLVDGVERAGEEPGLLPGRDGERARAPEPGERRHPVPRSRHEGVLQAGRQRPGRGSGSSTGASSGVATIRRVIAAARRESCAATSRRAGRRRSRRSSVPTRTPAAASMPPISSGSNSRTRSQNSRPSRGRDRLAHKAAVRRRARVRPRPVRRRASHVSCGTRSRRTASGFRKSITNQPPGRTVDDHLAERGRVFVVALEVAEAGEQVDGEIHRAGPDRQLAHVRADERRAGPLLGDPEQGHREIERRHIAPRRAGTPGRAARRRTRGRAPASRPPARWPPRSARPPAPPRPRRGGDRGRDTPRRTTPRTIQRDRQAVRAAESQASGRPDLLASDSTRPNSPCGTARPAGSSTPGRAAPPRRPGRARAAA